MIRRLRTRRTEEPKKQEVKAPPVKKEVSKYVVKKVTKHTEAKKEEPKAVEPKIIETVVTPKVEIQETIKQKKDYNGIGLVGDNEEILKFKVLHKQQRKKIGETLFKFIENWNIENPTPTK